MVPGGDLAKVNKWSAYTNNEMNSEKNHKTFAWFSAVVGEQQIVELATFYLPPKYYYRFISLVGYNLFLINHLS